MCIRDRDTGSPQPHPWPRPPPRRLSDRPPDRPSDRPSDQVWHRPSSRLACCPPQVAPARHGRPYGSPSPTRTRWSTAVDDLSPPEDGPPHRCRSPPCDASPEQPAPPDDPETATAALLDPPRSTASRGPRGRWSSPPARPARPPSSPSAPTLVPPIRPGHPVADPTPPPRESDRHSTRKQARMTSGLLVRPDGVRYQPIYQEPAHILRQHAEPPRTGPGPCRLTQGSPTPKITSYALLAVTPGEPHPLTIVESSAIRFRSQSR